MALAFLLVACSKQGESERLEVRSGEGEPEASYRMSAGTGSGGLDEALVKAQLARSRSNRALILDAASDVDSTRALAESKISARWSEFLPLLRGAATSDADPELVAVRPTICRLLGAANQQEAEAASLLRGLLSDAEAEVRAAAADALRPLGSEARIAVIALGKCLSDPERSVRRASALTLEGLAEWATPVIPELVRALGDVGRRDILDTLFSPSNSAMRTLETIGVPAIPALLAEIETGGFATLGASRSVLLRIGLPAIDPIIERVKSNPNPTVRTNLVAILGTMGSPAVEPLIELLDEGDVWVRKYAALALKAIDSPVARKALEQRDLQDVERF